MVVPGKIFSWTTCISVRLHRSSTGIRKHCFWSSLRIPPKTHCPPMRRPRLNLRFPAFVTSISTIQPSPPMGPWLRSIRKMHTSRTKAAQSMMVCSLISHSLIIYFCRGAAEGLKGLDCKSGVPSEMPTALSQKKVPLFWVSLELHFFLFSFKVHVLSTAKLAYGVEG